MSSKEPAPATPDYNTVSIGKLPPPATAEWTARQWKDGVGEPRNSWDIWHGDKVIVTDLTKDEAKAIAAAHNAALAAERELRADWNYVIEELERKNKELTDGNEQAKLCAQGIINMQQDIVKLREQLAAAVEALEKISTGRWPPETAAIAKAALAKIREGK